MVVELDAEGLVSLLITVVLPILVALVTKWTTSSQIKALLLLLFASLTSLGNQLYEHLHNHEVFSVTNLIASALVGFVVGVAMHFGLWRPTGAAAQAQARVVK